MTSERAHAADQSYHLTLRLSASEDQPAFTVFGEPDCGELEIAPGQTFQVDLWSETPPVIEVTPFEGGMSIWRSLDTVRVTTINCQSGAEVDGPWWWQADWVQQTSTATGTPETHQRDPADAA